MDSDSAREVRNLWMEGYLVKIIYKVLVLIACEGCVSSACSILDG